MNERTERTVADDIQVRLAQTAGGVPDVPSSPVINAFDVYAGRNQPGWPGQRQLESGFGWRLIVDGDWLELGLSATTRFAGHAAAVWILADGLKPNNGNPLPLPPSPFRLGSEGHDAMLWQTGEPSRSVLDVGIVQLTGDAGVSKNLGNVGPGAGLAVLGSAGADVLWVNDQYRDSLFVHGGDGDDQVHGGAANDALSGGEGADWLHGRDGNDILRGHRGQDRLYGGAGHDYLDGGLDDDRLYGGAGDDILQGGPGCNVIDGGEGQDIVRLSGLFAEYRLSREDAGRIRIIDTVNGRDGDNLLKNVEKLHFIDFRMNNIPDLTLSGPDAPLPATDVLTHDRDGLRLGRQGAFVLAARQLLGNDVDWQQDALRISSLSGAVGGTVSLEPNGDVTFVPQPGFGGLMRFKYTIADARGHRAATLRSGAGDESARMAAEVMLLTPDLPDDPALYRQWHLQEARVLPVWRDYTGRGVRIGMYEPSDIHARSKEIMDMHHPELRARLDPVWLAEARPGRLAGIGSDGEYSRHATQVAGVMVAARNGDGGVGVAYGATMGGHWLTGGDFASLSSMAGYDVVNHSWSLRQPFSLSYFSAEVDRIFSDYLAAVRNGRGGLGTTNVVSAGNGWAGGGNANYSNMTNSRTNVVVAALDPASDLSILRTDGKRFSNPGANVLVSAPGMSIVSAQRRVQLDNGSITGAELDSVRGTSFAAPIVAGTVALMLEANPHLGYRDVQDILALSARRTGQGDWQENGSRSWNGGSMHVSHDYGFGSVDALAAVRLAETWNRQRTAYNESSMSSALASGTLAMAIPDYQENGVRHSLQVTGLDLQVETVAVRVVLTHEHAGDLVLKLVSPSGTESILMDRPGKSRRPGEGTQHGSRHFNDTNHLDFVFSSTHHRGEDPNGIWTLEISDRGAANTGTLEHWSFNVFGSAGLADDHYVYTDEYAALASDPLRNRLSDDNGGHDTLNLAALSGACQVDLKRSTATLAGTALTLIDGRQIEDVLAGGFDDSIHGNEGANLLRGGRGDDRLYGAGGGDTLEGGPGNDRMTGGGGADLFIIEPEANAQDVILDLTSSEAGEGDIVALVGFTPNLLAGRKYTSRRTKETGPETLIELGNGQTLLIMDGLMKPDSRIIDFADRAQLQQWQQARHATPLIEGERILDARRGRVNHKTGEIGDGAFLGGKGPDRFLVLANTRPNWWVSLLASVTIRVSNLIIDFDPEADTIDLSQFGGLHDIGQLRIRVAYRTFGWDGQLTQVAAEQGGQSLIVNLYNVSPEALSERNFIFASPGTAVPPPDHPPGPPRVGAPPVLLERFAPAALPVPVIAGTGATDTLLGDAGGNRLIGGPGADRMEGGAGDDTYDVDDAGDRVIELAGGGHDLVRSRIDFTLPDEVEWLELTGNGDIDGTGNAGSNRLVGNGAANLLDGRAGSDTLLGGEGNDGYRVDDSADRVIELAGQGHDTVFATLSFTLPSHVEDLVLSGSASQDGNGNDLDNNLTGNALANRLSGGAGDDRIYGLDGPDRLSGGRGDDLLYGGMGGDVFQFGRGDGQDVIGDFDWDDDILRFGPGIGMDQLWFRRSDAGDVNVGVIGTGDSVTLTGAGPAAAVRYDYAIELQNGKQLLSHQIDQLIEAMARFAPPPMGQQSLLMANHPVLASLVASSWR